MSDSTKEKLGALSPSLREAVIADAVDQMCRGLHRVLPIMPLFPLLIVAVVWGEAEPAQLLAWLAIAVWPSLLRMLVVRRYLARKPAPAEAPRWANRIVLTALAEGLSWGAAALAFTYSDSAVRQYFIVTLTVGMSAGSIFITSFWPRTQYAYSVPSLGLIAAHLILQGDAGSIGMAVAILMYLTILFRLESDAYRATMSGILVRFENRDLVEQLREQNQIARQAQEAAERANVGKSKFLAAASHDLRQPLHALSLFTAALEERLRHHDALPLVENIGRGIKAMESLFNALLDISRLDAGAVQPHVRDVFIGRLLNQITVEYAPQAAARGLVFTCSNGGSPIRTDPALLETILRNLVTNAIRYTQQGRVELRCRTEGSRTVIEVCDTGIGIAGEHQEEVFKEFFQLHNPERDRTKGLGLGLAIVKRLTQLLEIPLELQSSPGAGSSFRLTLPTGEAPVEADEPEPPPPPEAVDTGVPVLVIDDEAEVREAMAILLGDWGYDVTVVGSLDEALAATTRAPVAIIADYRLREDRTGIGAVRSLQEHFHAEIPALIVTGDTDPALIGQARQSGFAFLHKPVPPAKLRAFLRGASAGRAAAAVAVRGKT